MSNSGFFFFLRNWFTSPRDALAEALYQHIMQAARREIFYRALGVPDTPEGRFELLTLHLWLVLRQMKVTPDAGAILNSATELGKTLLETHFATLDAALRESGAGDMAVPPRMKRLSRTFYSRLPAFDAALEDDASLAALLRETLYKDSAPEEKQVTRMAEFLQKAAQMMAKTDAATLAKAVFDFPDP